MSTLLAKKGLVGWTDCYINVLRCGGLSMVLLQLKDPLELFLKNFSPVQPNTFGIKYNLWVHMKSCRTSKC